uniref:Uncharacterized protein n=1 Tax=Onchocerca volvulus TaxID=6282 RepID=A0A8R1TUP6_ONCVO
MDREEKELKTRRERNFCLDMEHWENGVEAELFRMVVNENPFSHIPLNASQIGCTPLMGYKNTRQ